MEVNAFSLVVWHKRSATDRWMFFASHCERISGTSAPQPGFALNRPRPEIGDGCRASASWIELGQSFSASRLIHSPLRTHRRGAGRIWECIRDDLVEQHRDGIESTRRVGPTGALPVESSHHHKRVHDQRTCPGAPPTPHRRLRERTSRGRVELSQLAKSAMKSSNVPQLLRVINILESCRCFKPCPTFRAQKALPLMCRPLQHELARPLDESGGQF